MAGHEPHPIPIPTSSPIWSQFFMVMPLVVVATREPDGGHDLAPKHMAMPLGWENRFGFICSPRHATQRNAERSGEFTVSFPRPEGVVAASLAASGRDEQGNKPNLAALPVTEASAVDGVLLRDAHLWLECRLERVIEGFGENTLVVGEIAAAAVDERALRSFEREDDEVIAEAPLLAFLPPGRFARIDRSSSFPFPADFRI
jgi:flavin reductase (DIM6/NTAB) family NADH-FMN oxidoreductase RutF